MKKLFSTFVFVVGFVALSLAQDASNTAVTAGADALAKSKSAGSYVYTLPEAVTVDQVQKGASYYVDYFSVTFDDATQEASIEMANDEASSRTIMMRFLSTCGVRFVKVDNDTLQLQEFMEKHLQ